MLRDRRPPSAPDQTQKLRQLHGVEHAFGRHAALAGHFDSSMHMIQLPDRMGIRIDAE
jgi:hypothetical protein